MERYIGVFALSVALSGFPSSTTSPVSPCSPSPSKSPWLLLCDSYGSNWLDRSFLHYLPGKPCSPSPIDSLGFKLASNRRVISWDLCVACGDHVQLRRHYYLSRGEGEFFYLDKSIECAYNMRMAKVSHMYMTLWLYVQRGSRPAAYTRCTHG
ncbi:hypothetical protein C4D60_Mb09t14120 [Musa balbisiana]|uniref:Uncharacterized protein n=1 Tax=Musa balbisiana TaxID=52838 RepID=A0A4S8IGA2_MUSBA|nr:hypothetical protein C4D60_Mb09t14120 [Musa balbisiana]